MAGLGEGIGTKLEVGYGSPRWSGEVWDCSMPLTFDQYSRCSYRCLYCFAANQKAIGVAADNYLSRGLASVNVEGVKRCWLEPERAARSGFQHYIEQRRVMQWGGMADPFDEHERRHGVGLELMEFWNGMEYPLSFSSKGTWWSEDKRYVRLFKDMPWHLKVSIITLDEEKARRIERGCPSVADRLEHIKRCSRFVEGGISLRLRPFIIGASNPSHVELIKRAADAGAEAVSTEFFCLETRNPIALKHRYPALSIILGYDLRKFYAYYSNGQGYQRLTRETKRQYVDEMEQAARDNGMRFYVSDAHFKERCDNGSCCGLRPDANYSHGQFTEALILCRQNGRVTWSEIAPDAEALLSQAKWPNLEGFNTNSTETRAKWWGKSLYEYLRYHWNHPQTGHSPYMMFEGVMKPVGVDEEGDVIYEYDPDRA